MPINIGSTAISKVYVGTTEAQAVYVGSTLVWSNFTNMGMDKSGTQSLTTGKVTGWTARSGSNVTGDELISNGSATRTVKAGVNQTGGIPGSSTFDIMLNDSVLVSVTSAINSATVFANTSVMLNAGDRVWMRKSSGNARTIGVSGTYVYWE